MAKMSLKFGVILCTGARRLIRDAYSVNCRPAERAYYNDHAIFKIISILHVLFYAVLFL